jgi:nucleoside-diphosphate-sugar epimerase
MEKIDITKSQIINLGSAEIHKVEHVVDILCSQIDSKIKPIIKEKQSSFKEIEEQYVDFSKLKGLVKDYNPTDLETGLKLTIDWYREFSSKFPQPS